MEGTVFAVALNHRSQLAARDAQFHSPPYQEPPKTPVWFIKPRNTVIPSGAAIPHPAGEQVLSGATLALVVGRRAHQVSVQQAAEFIAGFALANEVSLPESSFYRPAIKAKCRDGFCPLGDRVVLPAEQIATLTIITAINDVEVDRWSTADLLRSAPQLLSALSDFATLQPGDVILLGTPQQRVTIKPGDRVSVRAAGFPTLENLVVTQGDAA
ncbi:fumarylacetoacetate hydrolase family protein [Edwardsiella tarda]|uniref:fumarylacetoacetate hydrolase family protein n=1 Tax=Edwardsiella tarda TaxID=636 RepID=UPI00196704B5|nr:fumarylacetoacetate hydrolase family protein [Edwardsiella tarda]